MHHVTCTRTCVLRKRRSKYCKEDILETFFLMKTGSHPGIRRNTPGTAFVALELYTGHGRGIIIFSLIISGSNCISCVHVVSQHLSQPPKFSCLNTWCLNTCFGVSTLATERKKVSQC